MNHKVEKCFRIKNGRTIVIIDYKGKSLITVGQKVKLNNEDQYIDSKITGIEMINTNNPTFKNHVFLVLDNINNMDFENWNIDFMENDS